MRAPRDSEANHKDHSMFDLSGKVACVVGGGGYMGGPSCEALAGQGATVVVVDKSPEAAEAVCEELQSAGRAAEAVRVDATDEPAVAALMDDVASRHGGLDVMVNCTYGTTARPMEEMTLAEWEQGMRVSLSAAFVLAREAGRVMVAQGRGSIIQFSSMYGLVSPDPRIYRDGIGVNPVDYGVAKAAILQLVRYQGVMWAPHGVRVNAIVPGPFPHARTQADHPRFIERLSRKTPIGRIGRGDECAGAVVFLACDEASYITATSITIDGGWTAW